MIQCQRVFNETTKECSRSRESVQANESSERLEGTRVEGTSVRKQKNHKVIGRFVDTYILFLMSMGPCRSSVRGYLQTKGEVVSRSTKLSLSCRLCITQYSSRCWRKTPDRTITHRSQASVCGSKQRDPSPHEIRCGCAKLQTSEVAYRRSPTTSLVQSRRR